MNTISLPIELLIKIVTFALDADREEYRLGGIAEIPEWKRPSPDTLDRVLKRVSRSDTPVSTEHINASGVSAEMDGIPKGVIEDTGGVSENTTCTYTVTTALRLYVIIVF
jgi:hypothetical protein